MGETEHKLRLRCLFFWGSELKSEGQYIEGVERMFDEMREHGVCNVDLEKLLLDAGVHKQEGEWQAQELCSLIKAVLEEFETDAAEGLMIAGGVQMLAAADLLDLAVVAYENPVSGIKITNYPTVILGFEEMDFVYLLRSWQRKQGVPWTILETERCYLREITLADLDDLFEMYAYEGMTDYIEPLYERGKEEAYQRAYIENMYGFYGYGMWLVKDKKTNALIGRAGLEHRRLGEENELEMGYAIAVPWQRQGYATEVCKAILKYAKANLEYTRINCLIRKDNAASLALVKKLGFTRLACIKEGGKMHERYIIEV